MNFLTKFLRLKSSIVVFFWVGLLQAQDIPPKPSPAVFVNDYANLLNHSEEQELEQKFIAYHDSTSTQIVVVILPSLAGFSPEEYAIKWAEKWQIGQEKQDNGLLLLIAIKEKAVRFEVGNGVEEIITDAKTGKILRQTILPNFKKRQYYQGIDLATDEIIFLLSGNFSPEPKETNITNMIWWGIIIFLAVIAIVILVVIRMQSKV